VSVTSVKSTVSVGKLDIEFYPLWENCTHNTSQDSFGALEEAMNIILYLIWTQHFDNVSVFLHIDIYLLRSYFRNGQNHQR
jgi:hypothetical protein